MDNAMNEKLNIDSLNKDLSLLLTDDGYEILIEDIDVSDLDKPDEVSDYVKSIAEAINEGYANGDLRAEISGSYRRIPDRIATKLVVLLRAHGVTLRRQHLSNGTDLLYWGQRKMK